MKSDRYSKPHYRAASRREHGISALESAGVMLISMMILLSGAGLVSYLQTTIALTRLVQRAVFDQHIKPLSVTAAGLAFDETRVKSALLALVDDTETALEGLAGGAERYWLEFQVAEVRIDPMTGVVQEVRFPTALTQQRGTLAVPAALLHKTDLHDEVDRIAGTAGQKSALAMTTGGFGQAGVPQYLPSAGIVGVRAFSSIDGSLEGTTVAALGISEFPIAYDFSAVAFRGEIEAR